MHSNLLKINKSMKLSFSPSYVFASARCLAVIIFSSLLVGCASAPKVVEDPNVPPFQASQAFPGQVKFATAEVKDVDLCNGCGDRVGNNDYFRSLFRGAIQRDLPDRVSNLLSNGKAVDRSVSRPLEMRSKLKQFNVELGIGIAKVYMLVEYNLTDNNNVIATWLIPSYGASDALGTLDNSMEALASSINNNANSLYLRFISDASPADAERASKKLAAIDAKMQAEIKKSANPIWAAVGWTAVTVVKGAQSVGKALDSAGASYARYCQDNTDECAHNRGAVGTQANLATMNRFAEMTRINVERMNTQNQRLSEAATIRVDQQASKQEQAKTSASRAVAQAPSSGSLSSSAVTQSSGTQRTSTTSTGDVDVKTASDSTTKPAGRKRLVYKGFAAEGVTRGTSEVAIADGMLQSKKDAEHYVKMLGNERYHGVLIDVGMVRCDAMGGNPLYRRCIVDVTYEVDDIP